MREILFRGKRLGDQSWVEGCMFVSDMDQSTYIECGSWRVKIETEVDPTTVGQYTGLIDAGGVKVFEGDIVRGCGEWAKPDNFVIRWNAAICSFTAGEGKRMWPALNQATISGYRVIGNIHDNPEMTGGGT